MPISKLRIRSVVKLFIATLSAIMLISLVVPTPTAEAQSYYGTPCPSYSIQDVFDDPNSDWDRDSVGNSDELYNGLNPCVVDTADFCKGGNSLCKYTYYYDHHRDHYYESPCQYQVRVNPYGDYDGDGVNNYTESRNNANPCSKICPNPTYADLAINPNGDWDGDGISNALEVNQGSNPCSRAVYNPCPHYTHYDIKQMPYHDWDGDGIYNTNDYTPCHYTHQQKLPHVTGDVYVTTTTPPPGLACPHGYPHYHPGNGRCYANPVTVRR